MWASMMAGGFGQERRMSNLLDGGIPYYELYETADGKHMSVGPLEPQFYDELVTRLGIKEQAPARHDFERLDELRQLFTDTFKQRTQAEWAEVFDGSDACCAPVLPMTEAAEHPHMKARGVYVEHEGLLQPAPAPRFSRTEVGLTTGPSVPGGGTREVLEAWGVEGVEALLESGAVAQA
jgi:alpha-methylacyl-CoA racemase